MTQINTEEGGWVSRVTPPDYMPGLVVVQAEKGVVGVVTVLRREGR